jgi:hypothetical protein
MPPSKPYSLGVCGILRNQFVCTRPIVVSFSGEFHYTMTSQKLTQMPLELLTPLSEERRPRTSPSQDSGQELAIREENSVLSSSTLQDACRLVGLSGKTSLEFYPPVEDWTLPNLSVRLRTAGIASRGGYWTVNRSECHSSAEECMLSDILEPTNESPASVLQARGRPLAYFVAPPSGRSRCRRGSVKALKRHLL